MLGELRDRSPRHIGPYRILARLGAGGMGEVYLGADTRPSPAPAHPRLAAVKTVRAELARDPAFRDRFRREMRTARSIESRFTARMLASDADAAEPWLATEYVAGPTLERAVRTAGPLPVETVLDLGLGLVRALRSIHHARVQHRDLKPANVLLGAGGPKVIDFGIARDFGASTMTATGAMVGSPGYMSPEHVRGGRHVVAASDVFCLASVLCYAATGEHPFGDGPVAAVLYRISQAEADLTGVPGAVRELIEDCLSPDSSARPDTVELESRFRAVTDTTDRADGATGWPSGIQALVAAHEAELARVVAAAGALAARAPTMPGASPVHSAETVTGAPPRPADGTAAPGSRPRRTAGPRTVVAVIAAALAVGVLGAFGVRALQDDGGAGAEGGREASGTPSGSAPPSSSADTLSQAAGLDSHGVERSRYFPVDPTARPDGWKPWSGKLAERPWGCALNSEILVCRTYEGGLEAIRASDGKPLWKAPSPDPSGRPMMTGGRGAVIPGRGSEPLIQGDTVVSTEGGMVRGRSAEDGRVRWERPSGAGEEAENVREAILGDGVAFFSLGGGAVTKVHAYDARTGEPLWQETLNAQDAVQAAVGMYGAETFAEGRLIASTGGGLTAYDAQSGKPTPVAVPGGGDCVAVRAHGGQIFCDTEGQGTVTLDAVTLRPVEGSPEPGTPEIGARDVVAAAGREYSLKWDRTADKVELVDLHARGSARAPRTVGVRPEKLEDEGAGSVEAYSPSDPVIVGPTALFADNRYLYTLALSGGEHTRHEIEGAPGNRGSSGLGSGDVYDADGQVWAPEVISLGGVLFLAFHDGTVRSLELPT
ncbi:protein kinase [Streptomyces sp. NPDC056405]|uniref:protein kinase domain-containing protein n=1 Tax=Streptomyces sp. NPDC056405 TaxID=3345811 RepID=UPI0035DD0BEC